MNRREFLKTSSSAASAALVVGGMAASAKSYSQILGANDRVGVALVGAGRRGTDVANSLLKSDRASLLGVCDLLGERRDKASRFLQAPDAFGTDELDAILVRPDVDAIILATPDHLHKQQSIAILEAGKHLYLEKPITKDFADGQAIQKAVEDSGLVCQVGTQQRSSSLLKRAKDEYFADNEKLGDIVFVRAKWSDFGWQRRAPEPRAKPDDLDWSKFIGPAEAVPYQWAHFDAWRHYENYAGGILADIMNHWVDLAQWMMEDSEPVDVVSSGGIYFLPDGRTNPDTANSIVKYKNWNFTFESSVMPVHNEYDSVLFHGTNGRLELNRDVAIYTDVSGAQKWDKSEKTLNEEHTENFLDAIVGQASLTADINVGLQGVLPAHLAVAAYRSGNRVSFDKRSNEIISIA